MLVNRQSAFVFQQIILPYLATTSRAPTHQQRYFSSSSPATRPEVRERETSIGSWEPYPASGSRRRTREYLGLELEVDDQHQPSPGSSSSSSSRVRRVKVDEVEEEEAYKRTAALAMERIIQSHRPITRDMSGGVGSEARSNTAKGKGRAMSIDPTLSRRNKELESKLSETSKPTIPVGVDQATIEPSKCQTETRNSTTKTIPHHTTTNAKTRQHQRQRPFPPLIHQLLQARQFRLAALHILNLPLYALDDILVENVAGFMERHGGGKAAGRLRRGKAPSAEEKRLMSDHQSHSTQLKLPVGYWSMSTSSRPPPRTLDDVESFMPGIELSTNQKFTAFCNLQLAHYVANDPPLGKGVLPPKSFRRPNTSLRQLRDLLTRIHHLERHRGFIPDRVTANIILSCWLRCSLAPPPIGNRINLSKSGWKINPKHVPKSQPFGKEELRGLFDTISNLIDRSLLSKDESLSLSRHVDPFVRMLSRGFKDLGDIEGFKRVEEWEKVVKKVLLERRVTGPGDAKRSSKGEERKDRAKGRKAQDDVDG